MGFVYYTDDGEAHEIEGECCDEFGEFDWHIQRNLEAAANAIEGCFLAIDADVSDSHLQSVFPSIINAYSAVLLAYDPVEYSPLREKAKEDLDMYIEIMNHRRRLQ